jgi:hypothetical protein
VERKESGDREKETGQKEDTYVLKHSTSYTDIDTRSHAHITHIYTDAHIYTYMTRLPYVGFIDVVKKNREH